MLQDLSFGCLRNEYSDKTPACGDIVLCMQGDTVLLKRNADRTIALPTLEMVQTWAAEQNWSHWDNQPYRYLFCMQEQNYFLMVEA